MVDGKKIPFATADGWMLGPGRLTNDGYPLRPISNSKSSGFLVSGSRPGMIENARRLGMRLQWDLFRSGILWLAGAQCVGDSFKKLGPTGLN